MRVGEVLLWSASRSAQGPPPGEFYKAAIVVSEEAPPEEARRCSYFPMGQVVEKALPERSGPPVERSSGKAPPSISLRLLCSVVSEDHRKQCMFRKTE